MKIHLHDEQFDDWKHPVCGRFDAATADDERIVYDIAFEMTPKEERCRHCARYWWPKGGEE